MSLYILPLPNSSVTKKQLVVLTQDALKLRANGESRYFGTKDWLNFFNFLYQRLVTVILGFTMRNIVIYCLFNPEIMWSYGWQTDPDLYHTQTNMTCCHSTFGQSGTYWVAVLILTNEALPVLDNSNLWKPWKFAELQYRYSVNFTLLRLKAQTYVFSRFLLQLLNCWVSFLNDLIPLNNHISKVIKCSFKC